MKKMNLLIATAAILIAVVSGKMDAMADNKLEYATLGGGCFWCTEAVFEELKGVTKVESGYSGGDGAATYQAVSSGTSGHAEVIHIAFDPAQISFRDILTVFFATHDPTTLNRQGADIGTQYRSVVFYHSPQQQADAKAAIELLGQEKVFADPIVTEITAFDRFHRAEEYHQDYYRQNKSQGYCVAVISPKMTKFRKQFADRLK